MHPGSGASKLKILSVILENIKSYEDRTEVPLQEGVTAILGENGSGKSTIQEAIEVRPVRHRSLNSQS
ncbi:hypothetical protein C9J85_19675 [Haloferax sp. wsp5]|nr:hypothetical protein C9J85_19675 [Haloferax sp. wsp5]